METKSKKQVTINNLKFYKIMKIISEDKRLRDFDFWSGAKDTVELITSDELDIIEDMLEDAYPDGMTETQLNDLFWFDTDIIAEWLGYEDWETLYNERTA